MVEGLDARLAAGGNSTDVGVLLDLGCDLFDAGRIEDAETCFRRASGLGSPEGAFNLGNTLVRQERHEAAIPAFELALARGETDAWANLGLVLEELGDLVGAARAYEQAEATGDRSGALRLAMLLHDQGGRDRAMTAAQRSADAGDQLAAAVVACWQWCRTRDPGLETALRAGADLLPSARADLGALLLMSGRVNEARTVLEQGSSVGEVECMLPLANVYSDLLGDDERARAVLTAAADLGDAHAHHNLAVLLEPDGQLEDAALHYRLAIAGGDSLAATALRDLLNE
ncbi:tetratricopeptide repeat protein [Luteipulveratus flavus]|uniref:Tetratricopeptide repeat protein n=1 Tax=Luteipulveratus flavus TaxID=3031728 RepID=A0ABT6CC29_9MICO|nr:tetratricopeptide repeat protein [Luteipulveratus sp. YIM 133296]MDF8266463.1 tetratricopeptide repeat protein [Luteipulveratus sp. YIM 133296]